MRLLIVLLAIALCVVPVAAQTPTSTPIPLPNEEIYDALQDADESLGDVDDPLSSPDGSPLLPDQDGTVIFGYAKWLLSPGAADELVGPFAPVISHIFIYLAMRVALFGIYLVVYLAVYLIKWAIWIFKLVLAIISTAAEVLNVITDFAGGIISKVFRFIGG